jgi:hypothetical protein
MIGRRSHDEAQSFDDALSGRAPHDEHVADLVRFAESLCEAAVVEPSAAFRLSLRSQLMTEAATVLVPAPPAPAAPRVIKTAAPARPVRRRVATVTAALVASAGAAGIVASSASAVPGEMLYPVKRSVESVELQLHRDDASRGAFQLAQASERLAEARSLSADGQRSDLIAETLDDFAAAAADGSGKLFTAFNDSGEESRIRKVNDFAATSTVGLSALSSQLPDGVADSFAAATAAVTNLANEATTLCASCEPADVDALVASAKELAEDVETPEAKPPATANVVPRAQPTPAATAPSTTAPKTSNPRPATVATTPAPSTAAPTTPAKTPSLTTITDPLLGGLLGDDTQPGLIPGLLGGLLGTTPK